MKQHNLKLETLTALEISNLAKNKELKPSEIIDYFISRIEERNDSINAFVYTKFDYAKNQAKKLEKEIMHGNCDDMMFVSVPFALKDFLDSKKGWTNSHGGVKCLIREDVESSQFCLAMEENGGVAIGKTNAPSYGFRGTCDNKLYGPTKNPFNTKYNSGGSSGGSAASICDGLVPIAQGTDGGGSIRIPASWCNLFGFKPSVCSIPSIARPDAWAATHPYCFDFGLTKDVSDACALLNIMEVYNPKDPLSTPRSNIDYLKEAQKSIKGLKIAYTDDYDLFPVDEEVKKTVRESAYALKDCGATIEDVKFTFAKSVNEYADMWCKSISFDSTIEISEMKKQGFDIIKNHSSDLPKEFIYYYNKVKNDTIYDVYEFNKIRTELYDIQTELFSKYDILISPTTVCLPVKNANNNNTLGPRIVNGIKLDRIIGYCMTYFSNFTGNPSASIPCGLSKNNLPIGMQIIGRRFDNLSVLKTSMAYEKIRPWKDYYKIPLSRKINYGK